MSCRTAACSCGQLRVQVEGEPLGVGICNRLARQRRTGSVFAALGDNESVGIAVGAFADPDFPAPQVSVYDSPQALVGSIAARHEKVRQGSHLSRDSNHIVQRPK